MRNFRSFVDSTTVHFPRNGLILLQGLNGAGKSSVGLALAYAFGFCPYSVKELTSWQVNECDCDEDTQSMQVILELETEQGPVTLARGAKTYLRTESKEITGATAINKALQEIIGLTPDLLSALTYRPQQTRGTFLSKTDGEKKEFLSILLGLNAIEEGIELTNGKISKLQAQAETLSPLVQAGMARLPQSIKEPEVIDCQPLSLLLHIVEEKLQKKANEVTAKGAEIKKAKEEMQALVATAVAPYEPMLVEINKQIEGLPSLSDISNKMEALRAKHRKYEMCQHEVKQGNNVLATKCEALKQQTCYACGQAWANAQDELVRLATVQTELMKKNKPYIDMLPELEKRIAAAKEEFQQATVNLEQLLNRKSEIKEERDQLVIKVQLTISRRIDDMQAEADKLNSDWRSLLSEGKQAESKLQNAERHNDSERRLWQQTMQQHSEAHLQQLKLEEQFAICPERASSGTRLRPFAQGLPRRNL
jgi:DNA repair exonuclease SbcCD ATPase subunit